MFEEEYNNLMGSFAKLASGETANLEGVFKQVFAFFEALNGKLKTGSEEEKKEAMMMMNQMYQQMLQYSKQISEKTGMSEEQLATYAENPSNFSPEQWEAMQEVRKKMFTAGQNLAKLMTSPGQQPGKPSGPGISSKPKEEKKGEGGHHKSSRKSKWMRS